MPKAVLWKHRSFRSFSLSLGFLPFPRISPARPRYSHRSRPVCGELPKNPSPSSDGAGNDRRKVLSDNRLPVIFQSVEISNGNTSAPEFIHPTDVLFVFLCIIGTSTVDENASGLQARPDIRNDATLALPADFHILPTPLTYRNGVFTEHPLARAGDIRQYDVEEVRQGRKICRVIISDHHTGMPHFVRFSANTCERLRITSLATSRLPAGQHATGMRGFPAGSRTEVKHHHRSFAHIPPQSLLHKHGRSLLHIVAACMKQRVKSECQPLVQMVSGSRPRDMPKEERKKTE